MSLLLIGCRHPWDNVSMECRCPKCKGPLSSSVEDVYCAELCGWSEPRPKKLRPPTDPHFIVSKAKLRPR
jgi:hypothetical protein